MLVQTLSTLMYTFVFLSLFLVDYLLGNGFVDMFQTIFCKIACFVKKTLREEAKKTQLVGKENPISIPVIFIEILVLSLTIAVSIVEFGILKPTAIQFKLKLVLFRSISSNILM